MALLLAGVMTGTAGYAIGRKVEEPFGDVVDRVRATLRAEGFGVLSEIDVQAALRGSSVRKSSPT